jgi:hypothetical protein
MEFVIFGCPRCSYCQSQAQAAQPAVNAGFGGLGQVISQTPPQVPPPPPPAPPQQSGSNNGGIGGVLGGILSGGLF